MRVIISAIIQRKEENGKLEILIQERWKPKISPYYSGLWEIPAGSVEDGESVYESVKREVKEETGLKVAKFINGFQSDIYKNREDEVFVFQPFICQQMIKTKQGLNWVGFVFICEVEGRLKEKTEEARNFEWINIDELKKRLLNQPGNFFSLQVPVLKYYVSQTLKTI